MLRLKMNVIFVESTTDPVILKGMAPSQKITMQAVTAEGAGENAAWSKWTPFGQLQFTVTNPDAFDKVSTGDGLRDAGKIRTGGHCYVRWNGAAMNHDFAMQFFSYAHLPAHLQAVSKPFADLAATIIALPGNPQRTIALQKLLESKDCAVRALLAGEMRPVQMPIPTGLPGPGE